jgi:hypothetical protein
MDELNRAAAQLRTHTIAVSGKAERRRRWWPTKVVPFSPYPAEEKAQVARLVRTYCQPSTRPEVQGCCRAAWIFTELPPAVSVSERVHRGRRRGPSLINPERRCSVDACVAEVAPKIR